MAIGCWRQRGSRGTCTKRFRTDTGLPCKLRAKVMLVLSGGGPWFEGSPVASPGMASGPIFPYGKWLSSKDGRRIPLVDVSFVRRRRFIRHPHCYDSGSTLTSQVHSVHLSERIAGAGRRTGRHDAVDFREIVCHEHNIRGAHILLEVLARFRAGYRYYEGSRTRALGHWPSNRELGERSVLSARDSIQRQA